MYKYTPQQKPNNYNAQTLADFIGFAHSHRSNISTPPDIKMAWNALRTHDGNFDYALAEYDIQRDNDWGAPPLPKH